LNWLKQNVWEIERSPLLSYLGAVLAAIHALNFYFWNRHGLLGPRANVPLFCWDFAPNCGVTAAQGPQHWMFYLYFGLAALATLVFLTRRLTGFAWTLLLLTFALMLYFYIGNATLASDIQALLIVLNLGFLLFPSKPTLFRWSVLFYLFVAGLRELTPDWLSGKELQTQLAFPPKGLEWVAAMGILAKWALPLLLLSVIPQRFVIGVIGLLAYFAAHYFYLRDFQSIVLSMFVLLFAVALFERRRLEREAMYQSYAHPEPSRLWWPILFGVFIFAQTNLSKSSSVADLLRVKGPEPFVDCLQFNFARFQDHTAQVVVPVEKDETLGLHCRQKIAEATARNLCVSLKQEAGFDSLASFLLTRGLADAQYHLNWQKENVCSGVNK